MRFSEMRVKYTFAAVLLISSTAYSQVPDTTRVPIQNSLLTGFNQNLNTLGWNGIAGVDMNTDAYSVSLDENFHSVVIKGQQNLIRDEQSFGGEAKHVLWQSIYGFGRFQSNYVGDNRQIGLNTVGASSVLGGLVMTTQRDTVLAGIGNKWDRQAGVENTGFTYNLHGGTVFSPFENSKVIPTLTLQDEQIFPRRNFDKIVGVNYSQFFSQQSKLTFSGSFTSQLRDFYFPADSVIESKYGVANNIQDRTDNQSSFSGGISMPLLFSELTIQPSYGQRQVQLTYRYKPNDVNDPTNTLYDTRIRVSSFGINGQLATFVGMDTILISMAHSDRNETHSVINISMQDAFTQDADSTQSQLNNIGSTNTLAGQFALHFGNTSVNFTGLASLFRYDTPSDLNNDDRDELTNTLALVIDHEFSPFFDAGFGLEGDLIHIVYIMSQRSANNNRNFIYKFFPMLTYSDPRVISVNRFEVLANYTVYDFEAFSQVHSFSFRQASFLDSTNLNLTSKVSASFFANVKFYTRGELYWSSFSEYPLNYFVDQAFWFSLYFTSGGAKYGVGYKYLSLTQYNYANAKSRQFASQQTNAGPTASLLLTMSHLQLKLDGWYQVSRQTLQSPIVYPNFELTALYNI